MNAKIDRTAWGAVGSFWTEGAAERQRRFHDRHLETTDIWGYMWLAGYTITMGNMVRLHLNSLHLKLTGLLALFLSCAVAHAADCSDQGTVLTYNPALRKAVEAALKAKGFYKGPIDGVVSPTFKSAIKNFRNSKGISLPSYYSPDPNYRLNEDLVLALFNVDVPVGEWQDQYTLMDKIGVKPEKDDHRDPCGG